MCIQLYKMVDCNAVSTHNMLLHFLCTNGTIMQLLEFVPAKSER